MVSENQSPFIDAYLENLLTGNRQACSNVYQDYLSENPSIQSLYEEVFKPSLYRVGELWEQNKIGVAAEHLATAITERMMNELYDRVLASSSCSKKIVLTCVENEHHQVGIKMVADIFEMHGWDCHFLGTGIPVNELVEYIRAIDPEVIALSISVYFNYAQFLDTLKVLGSKFPGKQIVVGGQAMQYIDLSLLDESLNILNLKNLYDIETFINSH